MSSQNGILLIDSRIEQRKQFRETQFLIFNKVRDRGGRRCK